MSKKRTSKKSSRKTPMKRLRRPREAKIGKYLDLEYESFCELSCIFFAEELIKAGYAEKIVRSPSYLLCDPIQNTFAVQLKKASKQETQTVMQGVSYTPDFDIYFNSKALGVFCWELGSDKKWDKKMLVVQKVELHPTIPDPNPLYKACCEVKPDFSRNSTTPKSMLTMKWLYQKKGIYVNLFRPNRVFEGLFVPEKYKITERGTQRLLKFKTKNLQEYIKGKI